MASCSKQATLFLVAALLCLICTKGQAARPEPGSNDHKLQGADHSTIAHQKSGAGIGMEIVQEEQEATRVCEGGEGMEECLMRRTLVAHTDYIYTQGKHN